MQTRAVDDLARLDDAAATLKAMLDNEWDSRERARRLERARDRVVDRIVELETR